MDNTTMDRYLGKTLDNRYEILETIGAGGMAVVYKALCHRLNRYVAVKILRDDMAMDAESRRRFTTESKAISMMSHPNIVSVYDVSRGGDPMYIVMELVDGISLKQYMTKRGVLSWKEVLHFTGQIAKALSHAHSKGIVHRDIKPHNIMLTKEGVIKVADFGIARLQGSQNTILSQEALGSVHYISPEQAKGEAVDARTDIYSLGIVMYEMLTGRLPFQGESAVSVAVQHINATPTLPRELVPEIPAGLEAITMKAMHPDVHQRYQSAEAFMADLERFRADENAPVAMPEEAVSAPEAELQQPRTGEPMVYSGRSYVIKENVRPILDKSELPYDQYVKRRSRSRKVSTLSGFLIVLVFLLACFVFLWNFFIRDIFAEAERVDIPNFVGADYLEVVSNGEYEGIFVFDVSMEPSADVPENQVIRQSPDAGKSLAKESEGIEIELVVSSGIEMLEVPDLYNSDYRDATNTLRNMGFVVECIYESSDTVTKNYVIGSDPTAGTEASIGTTVYLHVSGGPEMVVKEVPSLLGKTEAEAITALQSAGLTLGSITTGYSEVYHYGQVMWQSSEAGTEVAEGTLIYLVISQGAPPKQETSPPASTDPGGEVSPPSGGDSGQGQTPPAADTPTGGGEN